MAHSVETKEIQPARSATNITPSDADEFTRTRGVYVGGGIIPVMIQISFYLGFKNMYLLGCDCGSEGKKSHHFYKSNRKPRDDYSEIFDVYEMCKYALYLGNRRIYNSTVGGNLEVFKRKRLEDIR